MPTCTEAQRLAASKSVALLTRLRLSLFPFPIGWVKKLRPWGFQVEGRRLLSAYERFSMGKCKLHGLAGEKDFSNVTTQSYFYLSPRILAAWKLRVSRAFGVAK